LWSVKIKAHFQSDPLSRAQAKAARELSRVPCKLRRHGSTLVSLPQGSVIAGIPVRLLTWQINNSTDIDHLVIPAKADILSGYIILQYEVAVLRESLSLYTGNRIGII